MRRRPSYGKIMKAIRSRRLAVVAALMTAWGWAGCASREAAKGPETPPEAGGAPATVSVGFGNVSSKVPFRTYPEILLKEVALAPELDRSREADGLARRTDAALLHDMERMMPKVRVVPRGVPLTRSPIQALQVVPTLEQVRWVSREKRGWFTWGAGDSVIVLRVTFKDARTGNVLAEPVFRRVSNAFWGSWSNGAEDGEVEREIVADVMQYARDNR